MRWPWQARETRSDSSYTDTLVAWLASAAGGESTTIPTATAALEACAGAVGRAFAAARVMAPDPFVAALSPECLASIGRALIRRGEWIAHIAIAGGELRLIPASSHDVRGDPDPATWRYRLNLAGPDAQLTINSAAAEAVVHCRYATELERPWRGLGPLQVATIAGRLSAETVAALADEASGPRGHLLPIPKDGKDPTVAALKADLAALKGAVALVEQMGDQWGAGDRRTVTADWSAKRLGANPPGPLVDAAKVATMEVYAACGVPPGMFDSGGTSQGAREDYRRFLTLTVGPLARLIAGELSAKLEAEIVIDFDPLRPADLAGRATAFAKLVGGGMELERAVALSGLLAPEDDA